jgi:Protein of unknown function (DUF1656)
MIGELNIGGVFVPGLLVAAVIAFGLTSVVGLSLRRLHLYRFVWHAGLFDVALYVLMLFVAALATANWGIVGVK